MNDIAMQELYRELRESCLRLGQPDGLSTKKVLESVSADIAARLGNPCVRVLVGEHIAYVYFDAGLPCPFDINMRPLFTIRVSGYAQDGDGYLARRYYKEGQSSIMVEPIFLARNYPLVLTAKQAAMSAVLEMLNQRLDEAMRDGTANIVNDANASLRAAYAIAHDNWS